MFKPFFIHSNHAPGKMSNRHPRGFTAYVAPDDTDDHVVSMRVAFCSPKDEFNKKIGRYQAERAYEEVVNKREVPTILAALNKIINKSDTIDTKEWNYVFKFML